MSKNLSTYPLIYLPMLQLNKSCRYCGYVALLVGECHPPSSFRILQLWVCVNTSIAHPSVQAIHYHRKFNWNIGAWVKTELGMRADNGSYQPSMASELLRQRQFSWDPEVGWRPTRSPRHWASRVWSAQACPWWWGSWHRGTACPRPVCRTLSAAALSSRPE